MRLVAGAESGAYYAYVSIYATSQTPQEPLYVDLYQKGSPAMYVRGEPFKLFTASVVWCLACDCDIVRVVLNNTV